MGTIRDKGQVIRDAATARVFAQQKVRVMTLPYNTSIPTLLLYTYVTTMLILILSYIYISPPYLTRECLRWSSTGTPPGSTTPSIS